ncbi:unnamed protein product [Cutaneotrichosporon oleaginosum]
MLADIVITVGIGCGLLRSRTGWDHTDKIVNRLVRINLESQVPATLMAASFLVVFILKPQSLLNFVWQGIQSKFYLIGLLYTLNSRVSFEVRNISVFKPTMASRDLGGITVEVETETFEDRGESGLRSVPAPAENETIPLERLESVPYQRYGSSSSIPRRQDPGAQEVSAAAPTTPGGENPDVTLVGEYVYKQHDWD